MAVIQITSKVTLSDLVQSAEKLETKDLEELVSKLLKVQANRRVNSMSKEKEALLEIAYQRLSDKDEKRSKYLEQRLHEEILTQEEHQELTKLIDLKEHIHVKRLKAVGQLANLEGIDIIEMFQKLGLEPL